MDFQLMMGLLGPEQEVLLYQVGEDGDVDYSMSVALPGQMSLIPVYSSCR